MSMRFFRQGYWRGLPFPSPGDFPDLGIEPGSAALKADSLPTELQFKGQFYKSRKKTGYITNNLMIVNVKMQGKRTHSQKNRTLLI